MPGELRLRESKGGEPEQSKSPAGAKKAAARGEALCLAQSGRRDAAFGRLRKHQTTSTFPLCFVVRLRNPLFLFISSPAAGSLLPHPTLTCLINIFAKHLYCQYGRGPAAAASGVAVDDSNCATVSENPRCHSRISALQGRRANGPSLAPTTTAHCPGLVLQKLQVRVHLKLHHFARLRRPGRLCGSGRRRRDYSDL